jgi:electron transfer flavoprotein beta subunit
MLTCEKEIAEIPFASLPNLIASLKYEPEVWSAETPIAFPANKIGLKGSPTTVNKTTTPEKHAPGEVITVAEVGLDAAVKSVLAKIDASGVLGTAAGGVQ